MQLRSAELVQGNRYYDAVRLSWMEFCSIAHQKAARGLSKNLLRTATKLHGLLKRMAGQIAEVEQCQVKNVLTRLLKDIYLIKAKSAQKGKSREIKSLIGPIIKVINRLKTIKDVSPEQVHRRLVNLYIHIQDTAQVNVSWTGEREREGEWEDGPNINQHSSRRPASLIQEVDGLIRSNTAYRHTTYKIIIYRWETGLFDLSSR